MLNLISCLFIYENVFVEGNWGDTYSSDESIEFINNVTPEYKNSAIPILKNMKNSTIDEIVDALKQILPSPELGMLHYLLKTKHFNPSAACHHKTLNKRVKLHLWGTHHNFSKTISDTNNFHFKYMQAIKEMESPLEKLQFMSEVAGKFPVYAPAIAELKEDVMLRESMRTKRFNTGSSYVLINNRQVGNNEYEISEGIVQEYKILRISRSLNISKEDYTRLSTSSYFNKVRTYAKPPPPASAALLWEPRSRWTNPSPDHYDISNNDNFLNTPKKMIEMNIFIFLDDPESLGLLRYAFDLEKESKNVLIKIHPIIRNLDDLDSMHKIMAFYHVAFTVSMINAVSFLFDIIKGVKPSKAYDNTTPNDKYRDVLKLDENDNARIAVTKMRKYADELGINESSAMINNYFIRQKPICYTIKDEFEAQIQQLRMDAISNKLSPSISIESYLNTTSIHLRKMHPPIDLDDNKFIFEFDDSNHIEISEAFKSIIGENNETSKNPIVITYGYDSNLSLTATKIFHNEKIPPFVKKVFNFESDKVTIIPPFAFDRQLNEEEIEYVCNYVGLSYLPGIHDLSSLHLAFALFWRGDNHVKKYGRYSVKPENIILKTDENHPIQFIAESNPMNSAFCQMILPLSKIASLNAGGITFSAVWPTGAGSFLDTANFFSYSLPDDSGVVVAQDFNMIVFPGDKISMKEINKTTFLVEYLYNEGWATKGEGEVVNIGESQFYPLENGFVPILLTPGKHGDINIDKFGIHKYYLTRTSIDKSKMNTDDTTYLASSLVSLPHKYGTNSWKSAKKLKIMTITQNAGKHNHIPIPNLFPRYFDTTGKDHDFWSFQKCAFLLQMFPTSVGKVIVTDNDVQWMMDLSYVINNSYMDDNTMIISSLTSRKYSKERMKQQNRRIGRPQISGASFIVDINKFHQAHGCDRAIECYDLQMRAGQAVKDERANNIMTLMQFYVQSLIVEGEIGVQRNLADPLEYHDAISRVWQHYEYDAAIRDYL